MISTTWCHHFLTYSTQRRWYEEHENDVRCFRLLHLRNWFHCTCVLLIFLVNHAAYQCCLFSIVLPSDVSVSDWLMSSCCPLSSTLSLLTSPQCVCGLIMYFCLLTHDPHNLFGDPSLVCLNIKQPIPRPQVHAGQNYFVLCVARCCVAVCHDADDVAYSSSYVLSCACCLRDLWTS